MDNYYMKTEVDNKITNNNQYYYTKTEVDALINSLLERIAALEGS